MSRGRHKRLQVEPSRPGFTAREWTVEPTPTSQRNEKAQRPGQAPTPALARRPGPAVSPSPRPAQGLTEDQVQRLRSEWAATIVRPHRLPWQPPELDLADCPCSCTRTTACALHERELGGPRPYAR
jgi:hypothetical protein